MSVLVPENCRRAMAPLAPLLSRRCTQQSHNSPENVDGYSFFIIKYLDI